MSTTQTTLRRGGSRRRLVLWTLSIALALLFAYAVGESDWNLGSDGSSSVRGSGTAATQTRELPPFAGVDLAGVNDVTVRVGAEQTVVVRADDNLIDRVTTEVRNGVLVISERGSFSTVTPMSVQVTAPSLESVSLTGTGALVVEGIRADVLDVTAGGTGLLRASGVVSELRASLSGSGNVELGSLTAQTVEAGVSGSGRLAVTATRTLHASVSGTGAIFYSGNPSTVTKNITGVGAIVEQ